MSEWIQPETVEKIGASLTGLTLALAHLKKSFPVRRGKGKHDAEKAMKAIDGIQKTIEEVLSVLDGVLNLNSKMNENSGWTLAHIRDVTNTLYKYIDLQSKRIGELERRAGIEPMPTMEEAIAMLPPGTYPPGLFGESLPLPAEPKAKSNPQTRGKKKQTSKMGSNGPNAV